MMWRHYWNMRESDPLGFFVASYLICALVCIMGTIAVELILALLR
jgi:hypothetical protein